MKRASEQYLQAQAPEPCPAVTIVDGNGVRTLHLSSDAIQGAMRICMPDQIELEYVQQMMMWLLFREQAQHIVQLGLGAAALTKFCYRHFPHSRVTAIELNPQVIAACRRHFRLPPDDARLQVLEMDALAYLHSAPAGSIDVLQVDLYDAAATGPALSGTTLYQACAASLSEQGMLTVNLFCNPVADGDDPADAGGLNATIQEHLQVMESCFDAVVWLPLVHDANVVALAFKQAPIVDFDLLYQRAASIRTHMKLAAAPWVNGLKTWMQNYTA